VRKYVRALEVTVLSYEPSIFVLFGKIADDTTGFGDLQHLRVIFEDTQDQHFGVGDAIDILPGRQPIEFPTRTLEVYYKQSVFREWGGYGFGPKRADIEKPLLEKLTVCRGKTDAKVQHERYYQGHNIKKYVDEFPEFTAPGFTRRISRKVITV
jgi:hypothetical protein